MEERFILDTDFVPLEHFQVDCYKEVYQIEYELLYERPDFIRTHDNIVRLVKNYPSNLGRKAILLVWKQELGKTVKALKDYVNKKYVTIVFLPLTSYSERIETTLQQFEFAGNIIDELISNPSQVDEINPQGDFCVPDMYKLFAAAFDNFCAYSDTGLPPEDVDYNRRALVGEMQRRGMYDSRRIIEACSDVMLSPKDFEPSEFLNQKRSFLEVFIAEGEDQLDKSEVDKLTVALTEEQKREKDSMKVTCGVLYYILKGKLDDYTLAAVINYACGFEYDHKVKKANKNSIEKYLRLYKKRDLAPETFFSEDLKPHVFEEISKILIQYEINIPGITDAHTEGETE